MNLVSTHLTSYIKHIDSRLRYICKNTKHLRLPDNYIGTIDMPIFDDVDQYHIFWDKVQSYGYTGINIGLTSLWTDKIPLQIAKSLKSATRSFHGTSVKRSLKTGLAYTDILSSDKETIDMVDPERKIGINYDLYLGHDKDITWDADFSKTQRDNITKLSQKICIKNSRHTEKPLYAYIIKQIAETYHDERMIYLEMPGTKGWSMLSEISSNNLEAVCNLIHTYLPTNGKICIDIGHMLTRSTSENDIAYMIGIIEKYSDYIGMIHISSAGSYDPNFQLAYKDYTNNKYPDRHIQGLDFQGVIYEDIMISLLKKIRTIVDGPIIEVCESRLPSVSIQDYFENNVLGKEVDKIFFDHVRLQAEILGYKHTTHSR